MESGWEGKRMRQKCECELCAKGETTHNDNSHDQSLHQTVAIKDKVLTMSGGTTKCARVSIAYYAKALGDMRGKRVIELGSGTGLVGLALSVLGASVTFTDQEPMLESLQENIAANEGALPANVPRSVEPLFWGDEIDTKAIIPPFDFVVGSDLIFAHECNPPLAATYKALATMSPGCICYLASIERFEWEKEFFSDMSKNFDAKLVLREGDIDIWQFLLKKTLAKEK